MMTSFMNGPFFKCIFSMKDDECTICIEKVGMLFAEFVKPQNEIEVERAIIKEGNIILIHYQ